MKDSFEDYAGLIITAIFIISLFALLVYRVENSEMHQELIDRGLMNYNPKTGNLEWKEDNSNE